MSSRKRAFTLVELLVVVAIIALLVSILLPSLGRAKELAKRAVCASTVSGHGKAMAMYVADNKAYPLFSPQAYGSMTSGVYLYPKFYGVLQANKIQAGSPSTAYGPNYGPWAGQPLNSAWPGCWCPNFDWAVTFRNALAAGSGGMNANYTYWASAHPLAMGFQWNTDLRTLAGGHRTSNKLKLASSEPGYSAWWQWFGGYLSDTSGQLYYGQAVSPEEVKAPASVMESWDGWDLGSFPQITWGPTFVGNGFVTPGINAGPFHTNGRLLVNAFRHKSSPNILYADGHVKADATGTADPAALLGANYAGGSVATFTDWDDTWGNMGHVAPRLELE